MPRLFSSGAVRPDCPPGGMAPRFPAKVDAVHFFMVKGMELLVCKKHAV